MRFSRLTTLIVIFTAVQACNRPTTTSATEEFVATKLTADGTLSDKQLSLTFDDGPGPRTVELGAFLQDHGIRATFFVIGSNLTTVGQRDKLAQLKAMGHLIASHSYAHKDMRNTSDPLSEVTRTDHYIAPYVTDNIFLFRAPGGDWNKKVPAKVNRQGMRKYVGPVHWDIGGDWDTGSRYVADWDCWRGREEPSTGEFRAELSIAECEAGYLREIDDKKSGIVLMHDDRSKTVTMFKRMLPKLIKAGYSFPRLDEVPSIASEIARARGY